MSCGPCKETEGCAEVGDRGEVDGDEFRALSDLYRRLFESSARRDGRPADTAGARPVEPWSPPSYRRGVKRPERPAPRAAERGGGRDAPGDGSPMRRADRLLTALLRRRDGDDDGGGGADAAAEGDVTHLTARLPAFRRCARREPGTVNAALLGLDLERRIAAGVAGDGRDDAAARAAYDLAAAEARCKHPGAVDAAELAVYVEPAAHLAETAARFGARWHADDDRGGGGGGGAGRSAAGGDSPVTVVAYVGSTGPGAEDAPLR